MLESSKWKRKKKRETEVPGRDPKDCPTYQVTDSLGYNVTNSLSFPERRVFVDASKQNEQDEPARNRKKKRTEDPPYRSSDNGLSTKALSGTTCRQISHDSTE
ncbi:hypothetical protein KQX54_011193 [Cotesia glomerata]|uniref:Uncharacterized protein n=1 Tax=Cotesia glomerata TaxID=32391 RepID=A0AAV7IQL7_COTGL|nr:hypothetical protein KQX54_011193 [Cotesia glomerata]